MIIKNKIENEAVLSNVGQIGEFRIRNSAKAFGILSSGLYANKIRAIVREYSCNAYDSHVEAGRADCPFDVHLPNALEPYFAVRDYGVGLDDQQVTNIFTTYFESTKTETDDLIGGLGLGSKSAFSYTDNFTITAVKNGVKRIYTAFINEHGVPSVAMMMEEATDDTSGVEIKFSVNEQWDYRKFREEASFVYRTFKVKPNVTGVDDFEVDSTEYDIEDIIPGVSVLKGYRRGYGRGSTAIMGNIAYPLDIPNAQENLGSLARLLNCNLEMEFAIGELDIQASREGLSYIPETIAAVKAKLQAVNDRLEAYIEEEVNAIDNEWLKADFLIQRGNVSLTEAAVQQYMTNNPCPLLRQDSYGNLRAAQILINTDNLTKWNIELKGFNYQYGRAVCRVLKHEYTDMIVGADGKKTGVPAWALDFTQNRHFVVSDLKRGALERAKYHWNNSADVKNDSANVYVLNPIDKDKPMDVASFLAALHMPPQSRQHTASLLMERKIEKREKSTTPVNVMLLQKRNPGGYSWRQRDNDLVWRDAGALAALDDTVTYYYVPMKGFCPEMEKAIDATTLLYHAQQSGLPALAEAKLYGVRKADIETVKSMANWINLEEYLTTAIQSIDSDIISTIAISEIDSCRWFQYNADVMSGVAADSPYAVLVNKFAATGKVRCNRPSIDKLIALYGDGKVDIAAQVAEQVKEYKDTATMYPLLTDLGNYANTDNVAGYINLVDAANKKD